MVFKIKSFRINGSKVPIVRWFGNRFRTKPYRLLTRGGRPVVFVRRLEALRIKERLERKGREVVLFSPPKPMRMGFSVRFNKVFVLYVRRRSL